MSWRSGTFTEFKDYTLAVARGELKPDPGEPKIWAEQSEDVDVAASPAADSVNSHFTQSVLRERIVEHIFIGEALRCLWNLRAREVEVLRSEFDAGGYDLVMSYGKFVRHIQFKSTREGGKAKSVNVNLKLTEKPSGCVIWIVVTDELCAKSYRWLGNEPGKPLSEADIGGKIAKATRGNAQGIKPEQPNHRMVPIKRFVSLDTPAAVLERLFGRLP